MFKVLDDTKELLPLEKPHYLMGVGTPSDILGAVKRGDESNNGSVSDPDKIISFKSL